MNSETRAALRLRHVHSFFTAMQSDSVRNIFAAKLYLLVLADCKFLCGLDPRSALKVLAVLLLLRKTSSEQWEISAFTDISTSRRARIHGWRRWKYKIPPIPTTIGMS